MNKRLERKLDMFIIPIFGVSHCYKKARLALTGQLLFLLAYLDRGNLYVAHDAAGHSNPQWKCKRRDTVN